MVIKESGDRMIEIPEASVLSKQINEHLIDKEIEVVIMNQSPHKFAWFYEDKPERYNEILKNKRITKAKPLGGLVEIHVENARIVLGDGVKLRYLKKDKKIPSKNQLRIHFKDSSILVGSVQMYGGLWAFLKDTFDNNYYLIAKKKPSPLSNSFDFNYFKTLMTLNDKRRSTKTFLATNQRIPGLGNGVLQDILYQCKLHPKRKMESLTDRDMKNMFDAIKSVLKKMALNGGRDTEKDLFGNYGSYQTLMSKKTVGKPCKSCGNLIKKASYLGGSIYYCEECQKIK